MGDGASSAMIGDGAASGTTTALAIARRAGSARGAAGGSR